MVAKMLLLAASASVALASASARSLQQFFTSPTPDAVAFAEAYQYSFSSADERRVEGITDAQVFGDFLGRVPEAYADAEGYSKYAIKPPGSTLPSGDVANAETVAFSRANSLNNLPGVPDAQSFANSRARQASVTPGVLSPGKAEADALANAIAVPIGASALARSDASASSDTFSGARTIADAYGREDATAVADSVGLSIEYAGTTADADAIAVYGDASSTAYSTADTNGNNSGGYTFATSDADSLAERGGDADSFAQSRAYNNFDAQAEARAESKTVTSFFGARGVATSRATSRSGGGLDEVPVPPSPNYP